MHEFMVVGNYRLKMPAWARLALAELSALEGRDEGEIIADLIRDAFRRKLAAMDLRRGASPDESKMNQ